MKKKRIIILIIAIILIGILLFLVFNIINDKPKNKSFKNSWAEKYYETLDGFKDLDDQKDNDTVYDVHFYDIGKNNPIMVLNSENEITKISDIYYIDNKNKVKHLNIVAKKIELLYQIESKEYNYYYDFGIGFNDISEYSRVLDAIDKDPPSPLNVDFIATSEAGGNKISIDDKEYTVKKFDDVFIRVEDNNIGFSYVVGEDTNKIKEKIKKNEKKYKLFKEIVNPDVEKDIKNKLEKKNNKVKENIVSDNSTNKTNDNSSNNQQTNSQVDFSGTYYLALTDGTLAKDGSGTIIINSNGSCSYYSGWSDLRCKSYTTNDHVICLKTEESSSDICFSLTVDNKMLIAPNNEKYLKE